MMEVNYTNYAATIKCIASGVQGDESELRTTFEALIKKHKGIYCSHTFEKDSISRLHLHGHFMARKGILLSLYKKKFFHIHVDPLSTIEDVNTWISYINKSSEQEWFKQLSSGQYLFQNDIKDLC